MSQADGQQNGQNLVIQYDMGLLIHFCEGAAKQVHLSLCSVCPFVLTLKYFLNQ